MGSCGGVVVWVCEGERYRHLKRGVVGEADVVGDGAHHHRDLPLLALRSV